MEKYQWFKDGDHPNDQSITLSDGSKSEGKVVGFYRLKDDEDRVCDLCGFTMYEHGMLNEKIVCPGCWIITNSDGSYDLYQGD